MKFFKKVALLALIGSIVFPATNVLAHTNDTTPETLSAEGVIDVIHGRNNYKDTRVFGIHNCHPTGPYLQMGANDWNYFYDINNILICKFRWRYCLHSSTCSASGWEYIYY